MLTDKADNYVLVLVQRVLMPLGQSLFVLFLIKLERNLYLDCNGLNITWSFQSFQLNSYRSKADNCMALRFYLIFYTYVHTISRSVRARGGLESFTKIFIWKFVQLLHNCLSVNIVVQKTMIRVGTKGE